MGGLERAQRRRALRHEHDALIIEPIGEEAREFLQHVGDQALVAKREVLKRVGIRALRAPLVPMDDHKVTLQGRGVGVGARDGRAPRPAMEVEEHRLLVILCRDVDVLRDSPKLTACPIETLPSRCVSKGRFFKITPLARGV